MIANPGSKGTGCGCGGGGTLSVAPCSCGGAGCGSCHAQGIVRPRFFAGQLLTEDDLQLLTDYVGQKNRLHNRHLFGAGVVCGLEVTCHPCRDGRVIVHPGYALDCCGNDLTLSCAQTLDINAMVRDLRLAGFDCVDPCPEPPKNGTKPKELQGQSTTGEQEEEEEEKKEIVPPRLRYCLYLRYCEQPSDPVAPYSTGEECVQVGCEATRIREGVKFELRCSPSHEAANPLIQRLCACLGSIDKLPDIIAAVKRLSRNGAILSYAKRRETKTLSIDEIGTLKAKKLTLVNLSSRTFGETAPIPRAARAARFVDTNEVFAAPRRLDPEFIKSFGDVAVLVNRFDQLPPAKQQELLSTAGPDLETTLNDSREIVRFSMNQSLAENSQPFNLVRDWLIERLNKNPFITDCTLNQRVYALEFPRENQNQSLTEYGVAGQKSQELFELFVDYLRDCVCRALNPACLPCEDSAVLLACLDVEECQVKRICNMERTFVLSPAAVRYWLPPLQLIGNLVERLCCDPLGVFPTNDSGEPDLEVVLREEIVRIIKDSLCDVSDETLDHLLEKLGIQIESRTRTQRMTSAAGSRSTLADSMSSGSESASKPASAARVEQNATESTFRVGASTAPATEEETASRETAATPAESETTKPAAVKKRSAMKPGNKAAPKNGRATQPTPAAPTAENETPPALPAEPPKGGK
jgi:hypothetical protein